MKFKGSGRLVAVCLVLISSGYMTLAFQAVSSRQIGRGTRAGLVTKSAVSRAGSGADRYVNPFTGNDNNDGRTATTAWKSVARLEIALATANADGVKRILIDAPMEHPLPLPVSLFVDSRASGITITSAKPNSYAWLVEYKDLDPAGFSQVDPVNYPSVWMTSDTQSGSTIFEKGPSGRPDDLKLYHFANDGKTLSATIDETMKEWLQTTTGSYWNDGARLYFHPSNEGDPTSPLAPVFARSYRYGINDDGSLNQDLSNGVDIRTTATLDSLAIIGGMMAQTLDGDPYGAYSLRVTPGPGTTYVQNCYLAFGSKHGLAEVVDTTVQSALVVYNVEAENYSPYGGSTPFVMFGGNGVTAATASLSFCKSLHPIGKYWDQASYSIGEAFLTHGTGPGDPPYSSITISNSDFGDNRVDNYGGSLDVPLHIIGTSFGSGSGYGDFLVESSRLTQGIVTGAFQPQGTTTTLTATMVDCLIAPEVSIVGAAGTTVIGRVVFEHCMIDLSKQTDRFLFAGAGITADPITGVPGNQIHMHNSSVIFPATNCAMAGYLQFRDPNPLLLDFDNNVYQISNPGSFVFFRRSDSTTLTFSQWQRQFVTGNTYDPHSLIGVVGPFSYIQPSIPNPEFDHTLPHGPVIRPGGERLGR